MEETLNIGAAFLIGLLGATHCIGMCGGITSALSMAIPAGHNRQQQLWASLLSYNLGRISSYTVAGLLIGSIGWILGSQSPYLAAALRSFAATLLVLMGLYIANVWKGLVFIEKAGKGLWNVIQPWSKNVLPVRSYKGALFLGLIWGWLPCGLVYSTLIWASMADNPLQSSLLMSAFGLGTLPAILTTGLLAEKVSTLIQNTQFRRISGLLLIIYGLWTYPFIQKLITQSISQ